MTVRRDDVIRPDGAPGTHSVVAIKTGVCVLAVDDDDTLHLTDEFHYAIGRNSIEAVSGGIEEAESAVETARRELREELGFEAENWQHAGVVDPFTSALVSPTQLFIARGLTFVGTDPEGTELIRRVSVHVDEAVDMVMDGRITHAPSCILILKFVRLRAERSPESHPAR